MHVNKALWAMLATILLVAGCGGGTTSGSGDGPPVVQPPPPDTGTDPLAPAIAEAVSAVQADTCFHQGNPASCAWTDRPYQPAGFAMEDGPGEAILIVDHFPTLPVRAIRFRNRIAGYYRFGAAGLQPAATAWHVPARLWDVLDRFTSPRPIATQRLAALGRVLEAQYGALQLDNVGHGSTVFSLLADTNPRHPLVIVDALNLDAIDRADYCDTSGSAAARARLDRAASSAAAALRELMARHNVRFVNYSAGHTLPVLAADWAQQCGSPVPARALLRARLAAYAPLYEVLFNTPGVVAVQAAAEGGDPADFPYDQPAPAFRNRLRAGYFTALQSGLDARGGGSHAGLTPWPGAGRADLWLNTGVLPTRPFAFNSTPLLQTDGFGVTLLPVTAPQTSWIAPLGLSRLVHLRTSQFAARAWDDALVADLLNAAVPAACPDLPGQRCIYQDPLLHGQIEAVRLGLRPRVYQAP